MITSQQMRELEDHAEDCGITASDLMENAGRGFVQAVRDRFDLDGKRVVIFAGTGNNGGDGFVAARYFARDNPVIVLVFGDPKKFREETMKHFLRLKNPINIILINSEDDLKQFQFQEGVELLLVDALLGIGATGQIREPISWGISLFNSTPGIKVAVDLPSGMNPDTGWLADQHCEVDQIITFHDLKAGMSSVKKKTTIIDIGLPPYSEGHK